MKLQQIVELLMQISYTPNTKYRVSITYNTYGSMVVFDSYAILTNENETIYKILQKINFKVID